MSTEILDMRTRDKARVPPDQAVTKGWPILHAGLIPRFDPAKWRFKLLGLVEREVTLNWTEFDALPKTTILSDIHCVTGWSKLDNEWWGVPIQAVLELARPKAEATHVMVHAHGGYTTNLPLAELDQTDVLLAQRHNGEPLTPEHGYPLRLVVPKLYFWKSAKWVSGLEFMTQDQPGFWEVRGYHMHGDPWRSERYW